MQISGLTEAQVKLIRASLGCIRAFNTKGSDAVVHQARADKAAAAHTALRSDIDGLLEVGLSDKTLPNNYSVIRVALNKKDGAMTLLFDEDISKDTMNVVLDA